MKQIFIFAACIIAVCSTAFGQDSKTICEQHRFKANSTISKQYGAKKNIICVNNDNGTVSFILDVLNSGSSSTEFLFPGYKVYDFIAENDTVFFCGTDISNVTQGVIGFFCISQAFSGPYHVSIQSTFLAGAARRAVRKLTDMTTYTNSNGERHIVCVGECEENCPCIVDMYDQYFFGSSWYYTAGYVNDAHETFTDIDYVLGMFEEPHIVVSGFESLYGKFIDLRFFDVNDIFSPTGMQDYRQVFCLDTYSPDDPREWLDDEVLLTHLGYGYFATLSYRHQMFVDTLQSPYLANIHLAVYDINSIVQNNSLYGMVHSTEIPLPGNTSSRELNQLIYKSPNDTVAFLLTMNGIVSQDKHSYFCEVNHSMNTSGSVEFYYHQDTLLQGMDNYMSYKKYIMSGYVKDNPKKRVFEWETYNRHDRCPPETPLDYMNVTTLAAMKALIPFDKLADRVALTKVNTTPESFPLEIICEE